jgi:uncharacterized membrane protein YcaP (DUF421 family)
MNSWQQFWTPVRIFLGLGAEPKTLTFMQISLRGIIVFIFTLVMVRIGARRSLARAINGSAELLPTIGGGFAMVAFHRLLAWIAFYSHGFGNLIKGADEILIRDGELVHRKLRNNHITRHDLEEDLRLALHAEDIARIRSARLERSGDISFIEK